MFFLRFFLLFFVFLFSENQDLLGRHPTSVKTEGPIDYYEFLFLYDSSQSIEQKEIVIHPFYSSYQNHERAYRFYSFLYPLYYSHGTNYWNTWTFLYLLNKDEKYDQIEKTEGELVLTPLFYWGYGNNPKERFFSFFPFFGILKDKVSWEEIRYVLFPLYVSWEYRNYRGYSILWPLTMWGGDGFKRKDFRFLPFYSSKVHEGKYNRKTLLWPFFQWGWDGLDKKEPRSFFMFFPFYAQKRSQHGNMYAYSILYPISLISWGEDKVVNAFDFKFLWILFQYSRSDRPYLRRWVFFPFYVHHRSGVKDISYYKETNFYFIFWGNLKTESALIQSNYRFFLPFWYHHYRYYQQEQVETISWKLWPFMSYWREETSFGWRVLALWPLPDDYFEKIWGNFYSLIEYQRFENNDRYLSFLMRIMSFRWNRDYDEWNLFFLGFHYKSNPYQWKFTFLGGLLGISKTKYSKRERVPLYLYPKYGALLTDEEKETDWDLHFLWLRF
ncbi:MAG: hypothetical protein NZ853_08595 [Leptospiraceae bacterium]|nr:hypothetical protein [Leptospiraceae bacterium]MDW7976766.1 hypothetical protein [Leptospiraceae bacterium]